MAPQDDAAVVGIGVHDGRVYLKAVDRFGRFTVDPVARTVEGLAGRAQVNASGGGAGLGLRRIIEQSDLSRCGWRHGGRPGSCA